ncbi:MAG: MFS transporter [Croceibacterium sp.]
MRREPAILSIVVIVFALIVEGFDLQAANLAGPAIVSAFGVTPAQLGPVLSASLAGVLLGAIVIGPLGDRLGRRRIIISSCIAYGVISIATVFAQSIWHLIVLRFLVGVGLGGMLPNALALAGQIAGPKYRATATGLVGIGITFGGVVAGISAARLMPAHGWQVMFLIGGVLPLVVAAVVRLTLPAGLPDAGELAAVVESRGVRGLLSPALRSQTFAIWAIFALCLMSVYLLNAWIPLVTRAANFSLEQSAWLTTAYHAGGTLGGVAASLLLAWNRWKTAGAFALAAALVLCLTGVTAWPTFGLTLLIVAAGFTVTGTQNAINGAAGSAYPEAMRSAGLGWALGIGRIGSIIGPLVGAAVSSAGYFAPHQFFLIPVLPMAVGALLALWLSRRHPQAFDKDQQDVR